MLWGQSLTVSVSMIVTVSVILLAADGVGSEFDCFGNTAGGRCFWVTVCYCCSNTGGYWSVLQKLAESHLSLDAFSHLSDRRLAANGLDVKCWKGRLYLHFSGISMWSEGGSPGENS